MYTSILYVCIYFYMPETATTGPTQAATAGRAVLFVVFCCTFFSVLGFREPGHAWTPGDFTGELPEK